jgi:hypothetical protein
MNDGLALGVIGDFHFIERKFIVYRSSSNSPSSKACLPGRVE